MATTQGNEVEEAIRELKSIPGFASYAVLNNDGIVIKYENMSYKTAVHHAHQVLSLAGKANKYVHDLFDPPDNEVESIRLRTAEYEMIIAQVGHFTIIVSQSPAELLKGKDDDEAGEKKDGVAETKKD